MYSPIEEIQQAVAALQPERVEKHLFRAETHAAEAAVNALDDETGIVTGFHPVDALLGRVDDGDMIVVAGRPSMGKTALALCMALNMARVGLRVLWCSLEMLAPKIWQRLTIMASGVTVREVRSTYCSQEQRDRWFTAAGEIAQESVAIYTGALTPQRLVDLIRAERRGRGIDIVFVDHLGLMHPGCRTNTRNDEVSAISRGIKAAAMQQCVPIFALCQLNREVEHREKHRPRMSDLRDSGSIEQDADAVILLHREDYYRKQVDPATANIDGYAELHITKSRNGPTGVCRLAYVEELMQFVVVRIPVDVSKGW